MLLAHCYPIRMDVTAFIIFFCCAYISASTIKGPPTAQQRNLQLLARLGEEVKLFCPMDGNPVPYIEWYKGDETIDYQWTRYRANKKTLKIKDVDKSDSGRFVCKGINGFGKEQIEIDLIVIDPADFPGLPAGELPEVTPPVLTMDTVNARDTFEKRTEETLRISCSAIGKPEPKITWYKNGHELLENTREKHGKSILLIRNLMQRDTGTYTCVARNMVGETRKDFHLHIEEELTEHPDFSNGPMNRTVREGDTATFDCRVRSSAKPHIKWLKKLEGGDMHYNQSEVIPVGEDKYRLIHSSRDIPVSRDLEYLSQLILPSVTTREAGMYICFVTNPRGGFNYRPAFLTVIPRTESIAPESPLILILVIGLTVMVIFLLTGITVCVVRKKQKEPGLPETGEVRHNLMPPAPPPSSQDTMSINPYSTKSEQPLPPPPTPTQWSHIYGGQGSYTDSSHYEGNTYEVPHMHGGKTPAPSLRYGYSGYPTNPANHIYGPKHVMPVYYPDRPSV